MFVAILCIIILVRYLFVLLPVLRVDCGLTEVAQCDVFFIFLFSLSACCVCLCLSRVMVEMVSAYTCLVKQKE